MQPSNSRSRRLREVSADLEKHDCLSVKQYLHEVLEPQLSMLNLPPPTLDLVHKDIAVRLIALVARWQIADRIAPLLEIGREEALVYQPHKTPLRIRQLVVLAVRNSLLEDLGATRSSLYLGSAPPLTDSDIQPFTATAINALTKVDLYAESEYYSRRDYRDPFSRLDRRYPATWLALGKLAEGDLACEYPPEPPRLVELPTASSIFKIEERPRRPASVVISGIDPSFDSALLDMLHKVQTGQLSAVLADSFKALTRNTEKLFKIIEVALASDAVIVTTNYFIRNGYVSRRASLLRPEHMASAMRKRLRHPDFTGLCVKHVEAWRKVLGQQG